MDSVENRSKLYYLLSSLDIDDDKSIDHILKDSADESTADAVKKLNKDFIYKKYGKDGLERYLRSVLNYWDDYRSNESVTNKEFKKKHVLSSILLSPAKFVAKTYDYILRKTNSHFVSTTAMGTLAGGIASLATFIGETAYFSHSLHIPFTGLFAEEIMINWPAIAQVPIITGLISALSIAFIVGGTSAVFNHKKLTNEEIEYDIKKYSREFQDTFDSYNKALFNSKIEPSLENLNAIYMLSSTKAYKSAIGSEESLREYEKSMMPYISKTLKKHINYKLIFHHSPKGVGGFTLIYNSLLGKLAKKNSYSPVFLNTERLNAVPEYLFALFHELSHGAGATTEQMASYYAEKAMDSVKEDFPLEGYDLFLSVNRLESAISALSRKFKSNSDFLSELEKLNLPRFVEESFNYSFNPIFSVSFPVNEALYGGLIESKFSGLYASGPYLAKKMVEKGIIKTF
ncbi:MAG: hypothetical protein M1580_02195 [Candidatus Parvarchaeota archaeon]|nr:hypothetical protein [Candidatus Parvarchaeota archaeon]